MLQLDGEGWLAVLADLAGALGSEGPPLRLCLVGSAACLFGGMDGRTSADLGIWKPASDYDRLELKAAAEKVGLLFDPKQTLDPDRPYLQLIEPGLTQLGNFDPVLIERMGRLNLFRPPRGKPRCIQTHPRRAERSGRHSFSGKSPPA